MTQIDESFFGLHVRFVEHPAPGATARSVWPWVPHGCLRIWNAYTAWYDIQPERGVFDFHRLDVIVHKAVSRGIRPIIVLGRTPTWASARPEEPCGEVPGCGAEPADLTDWEVYVAAVATRYKGLVEGYEVWNEPGFSDFEEVLRDDGRVKQYFSGTSVAMVELAASVYRIVKEIDPHALVVSPSVTCEGNGVERLQTFLMAGGWRYVDVVGYHLYLPYPEHCVDELARLWLMLGSNGVYASPVWNTEQGYVLDPNDSTPLDGVALRTGWSTPLSPYNAGIFLARSLILQAFNNVRRVYWYTWDHDLPEGPMCLASKGQTLNDQGAAYMRIAKWLHGATLLKAVSTESGLWTCQCQRASYAFSIFWREWGSEWVDMPNATESETLFGLPMPMNGAPLLVGQEPVLVT